MIRRELLAKLKEWPQHDREKFAAQLLILDTPKFHGSKTLHYADGDAKKLIDNVTRDI